MSSLPLITTLLALLLSQTKLETNYYIIESDLPIESIREAAVRIDRVAEEYYERTRFLASGSGGVISEKLPFLLFSRHDDYLASGGPRGSAGVYMGDRLMAFVKPHHGGVDWPVVYHEGFHQFAHHMIAGDLPVWVNEGLAEYFACGLFTGDGFITGAIPSQRLKRIKALIKSNHYQPFPQLMTIRHQEWNHNVARGTSNTLYLQSWSMIHFLGHADNGAYVATFERFLSLISRGRDWDQAWLATFEGNIDAFHDRWRDYWLKLPAEPTADVETQATAARLTSFLARAVSQGQTYDDWDDFIDAARQGHLRHHPEDWLPPTLLSRAIADSQDRGRWQLKNNTNGTEILCFLPNRKKIVGRFTVVGGRVGQVEVRLDGG